MAVERCKDRPHIELSLPFKDLLLKFRLRIYPSLWKRTIKMVDIVHSMPRKMCRTSEISKNLLISHTMLFPNLLPYSLYSGISQRHIHSIESHPVNESFPISPLPPYHSIAESTVIKEESILHQRLNPLDTINRRHSRRILNRIECIP